MGYNNNMNLSPEGAQGSKGGFMSDMGVRELREFVCGKMLLHSRETYEVLTEVLAKIDNIREREER